MIYDFVLTKKKLGTIQEIISEQIKRILFSEKYTLYNETNEGLNLKQVLFKNDFTFLDEYKNYIKNYILQRIDYIDTLEVNLEPVRLTENGNYIKDFENYDFVVYKIDFTVQENSETVQGMVEWKE